MNIFKVIVGGITKVFDSHPTVITNGIPNLSQVAPGIWRGGQFGDEGAAWLKLQGIARRLKLNTESEGSDDAARVAGLIIRYAPISLAQQIGLAKIDPLQIEGDLAFINQGLCFIGCEHGEDRTGLVCAIYRVSVMGWTKDAAEREMIALGFHESLHGLHEYWENFKP